MRSAVTIDAIRAPTGARRGSLAPVWPADLAAMARKTRLQAAGMKKPFFSLTNLCMKVGRERRL